MANLFSDGFENGNLNAWSSTVNVGSEMVVSIGASLHGNYGLSLLTTNASNLWCLDNTPASEKRYRVRFYVNPNSISMAANALLRIIAGLDSGGNTALTIRLEYVNSSYNIKVQVRTDAAGVVYTESNLYPITNAVHRVEVDLKVSSAAGANDGTCELIIDSFSQVKLTGIDNDTRNIDSVRFGSHSLSGTISGNFYIDDFASNNDGSEIGPVKGVINIADKWRNINNMQINIGDSWKTVTKVQVNIGDTWKTVFG
jgi:hypothetical protein